MAKSASLANNRSDGDVAPSLEDVWGEVQATIERAIRSDRPQLVDTLPATGKSRNVLKVAADLGVDLLILTERGWEGRYGELKRWAEREGLDHAIAPSSDNHCPTFRGGHGETWEERVTELRDAGISVGEIHSRAEEWFGDGIPCQDGDECEYTDRWRDVEDADVIIGYYTHANVETLREGRVVAIDEFPGTEYIERVRGEAISQFLASCDEIPADSRTELLGCSDDEREETLDWFQGKGRGVRDIDSAVDGVLNGDGGHALAPLAALTILKAEPATSRWERADLGFRQVGIHAVEEDDNHEYDEGDVGILDAPDCSDAEGLVALDGTPTKRLWDLAFGVRFNHRRVLSTDERRLYTRYTQGLRVVQTTEHTRPYSSGTWVKGRRNAAILHGLDREYGMDSKIGFITSSAGKRQTPLEELRFDEKSRDVHYGNFKGSNDFADVDVGAVLGCSHWGDQLIHLWGAIAGEETNEDRGVGEGYSEFGEHIARHMREHEVAQAIFRFSRQGEGALVFVDTSAIPDWMPVVAGPEECDIRLRGPGERRVIEALGELESARTGDIVEEIDKDVTPRWVRSIGDQLESQGIVESRPDPDDGRATLWECEGLNPVNPYGEVALPEIPEEVSGIWVPEQTHNGFYYYGIVPEPSSLTCSGLQKAWNREQRRRERVYRQVEMKEWRSGR